MTLEDLFSGTRFTSGRLAKSAAFSPDGKYLIIGYGDGTARVWDIALMHVTRELRGHADQVRTVPSMQRGIWSSPGAMMEMRAPGTLSRGRLSFCFTVTATYRLPTSARTGSGC
ncbi:MAG: hypothetical protein DMF61_17005 [Blastocatellia bacterium AA13]|nr:MAG: hypothetical protein DMF61_17005 [Blastocatellia bacterium AA13]